MVLGFAWLVVAHFIGDFGLQSEWMSRVKGKYSYILFAHAIIWTGCVCVALQYLGILSTWKFIFLAVVHYFVDKIRTSQAKDEYKDFWMLYPDQVVHMIQLLVVYNW